MGKRTSNSSSENGSSECAKGSREANRSRSAKSSISTHRVVIDQIQSDRACEQCTRDSNTMQNWPGESTQEWNAGQDDAFQTDLSGPCSACRKISEPKSVDSSLYSNLAWRQVQPAADASSNSSTAESHATEESIVTSVGGETILMNNVGERSSKPRKISTSLHGRELGTMKKASSGQQLGSVSLVRGTRLEAKKIRIAVATVVVIFVVIVAIVMVVGLLSKNKSLSKGKRRRRWYSTTVITGFPFLDQILGSVHRCLVAYLDSSR